MGTIDRSTRRTASHLALAAIGSLLALALAGCGAAATPNPVAPTASAPIAAPSAAAGAAPTPAAAAPTSAPASATAGATTTTGNGAAGKDICGLLTPTEIGAAVGYSVAPGRLNAGGNACLWQGKTAIGVQLVLGTGGAAAFRTQAAFYGGSTPLSGLGDEAAQSTAMEAVAFRKGDTVVTINASDATTGAALALAKIVLSRL